MTRVGACCAEHEGMPIDRHESLAGLFPTKTDGLFFPLQTNGLSSPL